MYGGPQTHGEMLSVTSYQGNENHNHSEAPPLFEGLASLRQKVSVGADVDKRERQLVQPHAA